MVINAEINKSAVLAFICTLSALIPLNAFSQDYCHRSRILLSSSVIEAKDLKKVEEIKKYAGKNLSVKKRFKRVKVTVIEDSGAPFDLNRQLKRFNSRTDTCQIVKRKQRELRQRNKKKLIRRVSCSCDFEVRLSATPNDSRFSNAGMYGLKSSYGLNMIDAWDIHTGSSDVVVGVIDTGIDYNHTDLADNIWHNPFEVPNNGVDDDSNGYIDDYTGWDFADSDNNPMDVEGHGTHVAGTIGAVGNNGIGVVGVNWNVKLMPLKMFSNDGSGYYSSAVAALDYASAMYDKGINIVATNNSYGGGTPQSVGNILSNALNAQSSRNIIFVASAGNSSRDMDDGNSWSPQAPAAMPQDIILSVAATTNTGALASYSNYGITSVDIAAPGSGIHSTIPSNAYGNKSGTSMASPHITGLVAYIAGKVPGLTYAQIKESIINTGVYNSNLDGLIANPRIANGYNLLMNIQPAIPTQTATATPSATHTPTAVPSSTYTPIPTSIPTAPGAEPPAAPTQSPPQATSTPIISPTKSPKPPSSLPVKKAKFKVKGEVVFESSEKRSFRKQKALKALTANISFYANGKRQKKISVPANAKWNLTLARGEYQVTASVKNKRFKVSPPTLTVSPNAKSFLSFKLEER